VGLLLLLVLELAVVHQTTDRRHSRWSYFNQIDLGFLGHAKRIGQLHDSERFAFNTR
jgi:hypothetical protein